MTIVMLDNDITGFRDLLVGTLRTTGWQDYGLVEFVTMKRSAWIQLPTIAKSGDSANAKALSC